MEKTEIKIMTVSKYLIEKIKEFEGLRLEAYEDAAGVPTVGYGHTGDVVMGDRISEYWAEELLKEDLEQVEVAVNEMHVANTQGQFDALVSFVFNLGIRRLKHSRLLKCIRRGESRNEIKREFKRWIYAGGKPLNGLVKRREWEARRFFE